MYSLDANVFNRDADPRDPDYPICHALLERLGLERLLSAAGVTVSLATDNATLLRRELGGLRVGALVATDDVVAAAIDVARHAGVPLLLVAIDVATAEQLRSQIPIAVDQPPVGIVIADIEMSQRLTLAYAALCAGQSYADPALLPADPAALLPLLEAQLQRTLCSTRLPAQAAEFLFWCATHATSHAIAVALNCPTQRVYKLRHILCQWLHLADADALRDWARATIRILQTHTPF